MNDLDRQMDDRINATMELYVRYVEAAIVVSKWLREKKDVMTPTELVLNHLLSLHGSIVEQDAEGGAP